MIGKKINQLATELAPVSTDLTIIGDPISGVSKKITLAQLGAIFSGAVSFYDDLASFPATGDINVIYCAKDTKKLYLWSGSAYVEVFPSQALLDTYQLRSEKGVSNGYASLDSGGKVPISQLPSSIMEYKGTWNAATNTPTLANGTGDTGDVYICNVAGTVNFGAGPITFAVGDYVIYSGSIWQRSSGAVGTVTSVAASITGNSIGITGSPVTTSGTLAFAFAGNSTQYINGAGNLTTFPTLTGYVPYTGATANVDLGTFDLTADVITGATGVFSSSGSGNTFAITHSSGSGIALNITKGGNGEGLYINKTSGTGNAATIVGTLEATTLVKTGGTSSQFLKADGSVDSNTYYLASNPSAYITLTSLSAGAGISYNNTTGVIASTITQYTDALARAAISLTTTGTSGAATYNSTTGVLNVPQYADQFVGTVTSVGLSAPTGFSVSGSPVTSSGTLALSFAAGYSLPTNAKQTTWDTAYDRSLTAASVSGTTTKTLTLTKQDGSTLTASWTDINTDAVTSVFGRTGAVVATSGDYTTAQVTESGNLYFTNARAIGSTLTGYTSGAGTISATDTILSAIQKLNGNIGALTTGVSSVNGLTGAVTLTTTNIAEGTNLYYTDARVSANTNVAANTAARHNAVTIGTANGLSLSTQVLSLALASGSTTGALSSTDWTTFNNKQNALTNPVTGTGTTNYLPKFTGASTIGNSLFTEDGGNTLRIIAANAAIRLDGSNDYLLQTVDADGRFRIYDQTAAVERLTLTSSGNLGLGVTPSAWGSILKAYQVGSYGAFVAGRTDASGISQIFVGANSYYDGSNWVYANSSFASRYYQADGGHYWQTTTSGTAGGSIAWTAAMTLNASGNLSIGNTNDTYKLDVSGSARIGGSNTYNGWIIGSHSNNVGSALYNKGNTAQTLYADNSSTVLNAEATLYFRTGNTDRLTIASTGAATFSDSIKTGAPSGGTAQPWKLGTVYTGTCVPTTFGEFGTWFQGTVIEIEVNGTTYKIPAVIDNYC